MNDNFYHFDALPKQMISFSSCVLKAKNYGKNFMQHVGEKKSKDATMLHLRRQLQIRWLTRQRGKSNKADVVNY